MEFSDLPQGLFEEEPSLFLDEPVNSLAHQIASYSSSSPSSDGVDSPQYTSQTSALPISSNVEVYLQHKPRGSKGVWKNVEPGQRIRVTKGKGKKLRLEIKVNYQMIEPSMTVEAFQRYYSLENVLLQLIDLENPQIPALCTDGFSTESIKTFNNMAEVHLKLYKAFCKRLQFAVQIPAVHSESLMGTSIEFATHNSGTGNTKSKIEQVITPQNMSPEPTTTSQEGTKAPKATQYSTPHTTLQVSDPSSNTNVTSSFVEPSRVQWSSNLNQETSDAPKRKRISDEPFEFVSHPLEFGKSAVTLVPGSLDVKGVVRARGYMQFSDIRLKSNITDIVDAIDIVSKLKGQMYQWKSGSSHEIEPSRQVIGLIAQEVQKVLPEVVHRDPVSGFLSVSYTEILPVLIEAFNQFMKQCDNEKEEVQTQMAVLHSRLDQVTRHFQSAEKQRTEDIQTLIVQTRELTKQVVLKQTSPKKSSKKPIFILPQENSVYTAEKPPGLFSLWSSYVFLQRKTFYSWMLIMFSFFLICTITGVAFTMTGRQSQQLQPSLWSVGFTAANTTQTLDKRLTTHMPVPIPPSTSTTSSTSTTGTTHSTLPNDEPINGYNFPTNQGATDSFMAGMILLVGGFMGMSTTALFSLYQYRRDYATLQSAGQII